MNKKLNFFNKNGYLLIQSSQDILKIKDYTTNWIFSLLGREAANNPNLIHEINFDEVFYSSKLVQKNRHKDDQNLIKYIIDSYNLMPFINDIFHSKWRIWDEGFGSLGLRIVRPNSNDGYSWSCKAWGPAKNVLSFSTTIFITSPIAGTAVLPKSHLLKNLPTTCEDSIHCKDELRLDVRKVDVSSKTHPVSNIGDLLIMNPRLIHTEKNFSENSTRISLEFRIEPL